MSDFQPSNQNVATIQCVISHRSLPAGRAFAKLAISNITILAQTEGDIEVELPLKGIKLEWGGANNKLLFVSHPDYPGWSIFTRDRTLIKRLESSGSEDVKDALSYLHRASSRSIRSALIALTALIAISWVVTLSWKPLIATCANLIPLSWEKKLGEAVFFGVKNQTSIISDEALTAELSRFVAPLTQAVGARGRDLQFYIARSENLNAFALPGGKIVVNSAAILGAARPEELYGVLAHEISHITLRHTARQIISVFGVYMTVDLILGNIVGTVAAVSQGASYLLQQGFSREQEREADLQGLRYLFEANIDPNGLIEFFNRLEHGKKTDGVLSDIDKSLSFLSTHPASSERIAELSALIKKQQGTVYRSFAMADFDALKEKLRAHLHGAH
jgi:predicted Zn-dependent protease